MLSWPGAERAPGAAEERLPGIGRRRQRDQRRQPVKEVARLRVMSPALPDHTETDSSMMFIAAKPATARQVSSQRAWRASSRFGTRPARTDGRGSRSGRARRITSPASSAPSRQPPARRRLVKLSRASAIPGNCRRPFSILRMQPAQPDALDRKVHMRRAVGVTLDAHRPTRSQGSPASLASSAQNDACSGAEHAGVAVATARSRGPIARRRYARVADGNGRARSRRIATA